MFVARVLHRLRVHWQRTAVIVVAVAAATWWLVGFALGSRVTVVQPSRGPIVETIVTSGRVAATSEVELAAATAGTVREVAVDEGDRVAAGQLLVQLEDDAELAARDQARAVLAQAEVVVRQVAGVGAPLAREELDQARVRAATAHREAERGEQLATSGAITGQALDDLRTAADLAASALRAAEVRASSYAAGGPERRRAIAAFDAARAAVAAADAALERTRIRAPAEGTITRRTVEPGALLQPGIPALTFVRAAPLELVVEPDERNLARLRVGQQALASAEAYPATSFAARVSFIAPAVDRRRGTIEVRLSVPAPPPYLRPDMTVSVDLEVARHAAALRLPTAAVRELATARPWVLVADGGRARRVDVTLGLRGGEEVEIAGGLGPDARVILDEGVAAGDRIRPEPAR